MARATAVLVFAKVWVGAGGGAELLAQKYLLHVGRLIGSLVGPIEPYSGLLGLIGAY